MAFLLLGLTRREELLSVVSNPLGYLLVLRVGSNGLFVASGGLNGFCEGSNRMVIPRWGRTSIAWVEG